MAESLSAQYGAGRAYRSQLHLEADPCDEADHGRASAFAGEHIALDYTVLPALLFSPESESIRESSILYDIETEKLPSLTTDQADSEVLLVAGGLVY